MASFLLDTGLAAGGVARRGMLMIASLRPDAFKRADVTFAEAIARWVGSVAQY